MRIPLCLFTLCLLFAPCAAQRQIELDKRWGFITPCVTTKVEVEKILGNSIKEDKTHFWQTYDTENERIHVIYKKTSGVEKSCGNSLPIDTVIRFFVYPSDNIKLSELKIDLTKYRKDALNSPREIVYFNGEEGIMIVSVIVESKDKIKTEIVESIEFRPKSKDISDSAENEYYPVATDSFYYPNKNQKENFNRVIAFLDNYIMSLKQHLRDGMKIKGYVLVYFDKKLPLKEYKNHLNKIKSFVYKRHKISPRTLLIIEGGLREKSEIELYTLPSDWKPPVPKPIQKAKE